ncbi:MAG TPA: hypothetical protein VM470_01425 [Acidimicrobiia bacterium]|nr:hypothetical protein [Acidimicrobiia bacterium]
MKRDTPGPFPSRFIGRRQAVGLTILATGATLAAAVAMVAPGTAGIWAGAVAVGLTMAAPLLRVGWLTVRWLQEGDLRFAAAGAALLAIITLGAILAA